MTQINRKALEAAQAVLYTRFHEPESFIDGVAEKAITAYLSSLPPPTGEVGACSELLDDLRAGVICTGSCETDDGEVEYFDIEDAEDKIARAADALQAAHERAERAEDRLRKINVLAQNAGVADAHHITDLTRERDNLAAQLAKAREALELYGEHQDECKVRIDILKDRDCGLSETLASLPAQPEGWRPIESAPRDGTHILIVWPLGKTNARLTVAQWIKGAEQGWWTPTDATFRHYLHPTHWMPLPTPPTKGEG